MNRISLHAAREATNRIALLQREALFALVVRGDASDRRQALKERRSLIEGLIGSHHQLEMIRRAERRIPDRNYGLCARCGHEIQSPRLNEKPWAEYCTTYQDRKEVAHTVYFEARRTASPARPLVVR